MPMLVQMDNAVGKTTAGTREVRAAGVGKTAPWGAQYADVIYEIAISDLNTRLAMLFSDCFAQGQPRGGVGPVRSTRVAQLLLREEWQGGFVHAGGSYGWQPESAAELLNQTHADQQGVLFNVLRIVDPNIRSRVKGVKAPGNLNVDIAALRAMIPAEHNARPRAFRFTDETTYGEGYAPASVIHLDWGSKDWISHFVYNAETGHYLRYCGAGVKPERWAEFKSFAAVDDRIEEHMASLPFANVIVQRVAYDVAGRTKATPDAGLVGQGNADVFIGGRYIAGYWIRRSIAERTVFYDDTGAELRLLRGRTFIAMLPPQSLCSFDAE